jgi:hydrogenase maturation protein HypF
VEAVCEVSNLEERLVCAPEAPIVLLRRKLQTNKNRSSICASVAPHNPNLGVMLPYTPLHHLVLSQVGSPIVATSGNLSDEPICIDQYEALERLAHIADLFLVHDRPITRHVDDSIVRAMAGRELILRRARGYAPLPIELNFSPPVTLGVGAHLKNSIALSVGRQVFVSQHIGDLETVPAFAAFRRVIADFERLYDARPTVIAADLHPDYLSTKFARERGLPVIHVQHHFAHILSCMAENEVAPPVLGVAWDGTGYGNDGTIWGGEFLKITKGGFERIGHLRGFGLPGGEAAIREPRRSALGILYEIFGDSAFTMTNIAPMHAFSPAEYSGLQTMIKRRLNTPFTTSVGRLFDAVASLVGLRQVTSYEGQAAAEFEFALNGIEIDQAYPMSFIDDVVDWEPMIVRIMRELLDGFPVGEIAAKVHNTLVEALISVARHTGETRVVLAGGCFQNEYLTTRAVRRLREEGFSPYWHQRIPPNDGGIALGQAVAAARHLAKGNALCV